MPEEEDFDALSEKDLVKKLVDETGGKHQSEQEKQYLKDHVDNEFKK